MESKSVFVVVGLFFGKRRPKFRGRRRVKWRKSVLCFSSFERRSLSWPPCSRRPPRYDPEGTFEPPLPRLRRPSCVEGEARSSGRPVSGTETGVEAGVADLGLIDDKRKDWYTTFPARPYRLGTRPSRRDDPGGRFPSFLPSTSRGSEGGPEYPS